MREDQAEEVLADYIAAEVIAKELAHLPADQRRSNLRALLRQYCASEEDIQRLHSVTYNDSHPDFMLRIDGIFGANSNLRQVVGCPDESPSYKTCSMKTVKPPDDRSSPNTRGTKTPETKTHKGMNQ
jgi:hypothetical protein